MAKATYMYWQKRLDRENPNQTLEDIIKDIRLQHPNYGYRRIHAVLVKQGYTLNIKKTHRLCKKLGIQVTSFTRKSRKFSTYKGTVGTIAPNKIKRRFKSTIPHQKITTDTTEFKYYEINSNGNMNIKKLYLDPYMDMYNSEIITHKISKQPNGESMIDLLEETISETSDCKYRRTFHSDQGWAYQMKAYTRTLKENEIYQSMSRKGNCHDNSVMENFFGIMKQEMYYGINYYSYEELEAAINKYIKYYNEERIKEKLGWMSPIEYRLNYLTA